MTVHLVKAGERHALICPCLQKGWYIQEFEPVINYIEVLLAEGWLLSNFTAPYDIIVTYTLTTHPEYFI